MIHNDVHEERFRRQKNCARSSKLQTTQTSTSANGASVFKHAMLPDMPVVLGQMVEREVSLRSSEM